MHFKVFDVLTLYLVPFKFFQRQFYYLLWELLYFPDFGIWLLRLFHYFVGLTFHRCQYLL